MNFILPAAASLALGGCTAAAQEAPQITVAKSGGHPAIGPAANFTGEVRIVAPFRSTAPARVGGATVIFAKGAHTAWHTHPLGQTLIVTAGSGFVQQWSSRVEAIGPGDVIWIPPGVKHWHGAGPDEGMTHIAIAEQLDGKSVEWMEKLSDEQYPG